MVSFLDLVSSGVRTWTRLFSFQNLRSSNSTYSATLQCLLGCGLWPWLYFRPTWVLYETHPCAAPSPGIPTQLVWVRCWYFFKSFLENINIYLESRAIALREFAKIYFLNLIVGLLWVAQIIRNLPAMQDTWVRLKRSRTHMGGQVLSPYRVLCWWTTLVKE